MSVSTKPKLCLRESRIIMRAAAPLSISDKDIHYKRNIVR